MTGASGIYCCICGYDDDGVPAAEWGEWFPGGQWVCFVCLARLERDGEAVGRIVAGG